MSLKKCTICGTKIVLTPTAAERAAKDCTGKTAAHYTAIFVRHSSCELVKRDGTPEQLVEHIAKMNPPKRTYGF